MKLFVDWMMQLYDSLVIFLFVDWMLKIYIYRMFCYNFENKNIIINNLLIIQYYKFSMENLKDLKENNLYYKLNFYFYISLFCVFCYFSLNYFM